MQESFDFAADDLEFIRAGLTRTFGRLEPFARSEPIWRLVRSLIGCRTYDAVAESALEGLKQRWPHPSLLAAVSPRAVQGNQRALELAPPSR
jgi:hypothetical protein